MYRKGAGRFPFFVPVIKDRKVTAKTIDKKLQTLSSELHCFLKKKEVLKK